MHGVCFPAAEGNGGRMGGKMAETNDDSGPSTMYLQRKRKSSIDTCICTCFSEVDPLTTLATVYVAST